MQATIRRPISSRHVHVSEDEFLRRVVVVARSYGWLVHHTRMDRNNIVGDPGFPDLTMVKGRRVIFAELKVPPNKPSLMQRAWLAAFDRVGSAVESYLWEPRQMQEIIDTLSSAI